MTGPMDTLGERMRELRADGWVEEFSVDDTGVRCDACRRWAAPEDVVVDVVHRFEGPSDPGDQEGMETEPTVADVVQRLRLPGADSVFGGPTARPNIPD